MEFGTDIKLVNGDFSPAPDGDVETVSGVMCLIQDIKHEAMTYPGDLFYDSTYGYGLQDFIQRQNNAVNRNELTQRIKSKLMNHELIDIDSIKVEAQDWKLESITTLVSFDASGESVQLGIAVSLDQISVEVI